MPVKMISLKPHPYAGKRLKVGQEFEARGQSDARLLRALGRAEDAPVVAALAPVVPAPAPRHYRSRAVEAPAAEASPAVEPEGDAKPKRTYRRRDMTAEG